MKHFEKIGKSKSKGGLGYNSIQKEWIPNGFTTAIHCDNKMLKG